ncbi:MAG TPA: tetrahydromethanopterin S-methyltransferase subunit D [Methanoregulaceae archaeon]|jgi:tetrahydromethanopterin S-methyltransferase subunit D|nr:tetrahydromethanopterin S-methyltransferase subunit D [Methanoregulaceae archaeon]MDD3090836.1 tetrahydromethanopterin S-methyltransferase subunit D [Methanoregulaceae archaeon]MDD5049059.1 tetrahydromethanopterin S-methyltransferase subunit D [Methanoregulaceae archaeon]MDD5684921.1 tetrahydromethanopterin S-methyltransferase subunit D [Methanoregulaceae archaeon]HOP66954.1 tetrahydromethanopterin S-methyltransferase subunit D [Methanoregulaceae archaeon]
MSALGAKPAAAGGMDPMASAIGVVILLVVIAATYMLAGTGMALMALIGVIVGGVLVGFGVHFVPVGGAPAAMGQAPGIATGVAMLAAGAGLAGLFGGAWAAGQGLVIAVITGGIGGGLMMAITCMFVNFIYVFGMGIPSASGKVAKDPITGDTQAEFKSQGTEGHGLPFISYVGGVIGGTLGGAGGTLIYIMLLDIYQAELPAMMDALPAQILPIAVSLAGIFAIGMFLVNAVLAAYNITGTIEGPHDPKFKRFPRAIVASAVASAVCGMVAIMIVAI